MAELYQCDKCKNQTTNPLWIEIAFDRTPEEIKQLMAANDAPLGSEAAMKKASEVRKEFDLCRECYDKFIQEWNL